MPVRSALIVFYQVMDQNLSSSELIGVVYVDLNPLIMRTAHGSDKDLIVEGWFPLYDTLRGIQGSLFVAVKLQFIGNDNPFRDSAAGVQFFSTSSLSPSEFVIQEVAVVYYSFSLPYTLGRYWALLWTLWSKMIQRCHGMTTFELPSPVMTAGI